MFSKLFVAAVSVIAGILLLAALGVGSKPDTQTGFVPIGSTVELLRECASLPTRAAWDEFSSAMAIDDHAAAARIILGSGGRMVAAGTRVLVRDQSVIHGLVEATDQSADLHMGEDMFLGQYCFKVSH